MQGKTQMHHMFNDKSAWALILGGSSGLGLATAKKLAGHGFNIIVVHRDRKTDMDIIQKDFRTIEALPVRFKSFNVDAVHADSRAGLLLDIRKLLGSDGKIKVMVHSIAKGNLKPMYSFGAKELEHQDFQLTIGAMAISLYDWTRALVQADIFHADARIISFTSEGNTRTIPYYAAISAAKAVLESITRSIAVEYAPLGIKANCVQAGVTKTRSFDMLPEKEAILASALKRNPVGRLTTPEDVANVAYLLCLDEAKWITGTVIKVDGGESLR